MKTRERGYKTLHYITPRYDECSWMGWRLGLTASKGHPAAAPVLRVAPPSHQHFSPLWSYPPLATRKLV